MNTYRIKMTPKKGGGISYALMQASNRAVLWNIAKEAYPGFHILHIEKV